MNNINDMDYNSGVEEAKQHLKAIYSSSDQGQRKAIKDALNKRRDAKANAEIQEDNQLHDLVEKAYSMGKLSEDEKIMFEKWMENPSVNEAALTSFMENTRRSLSKSKNESCGYTHDAESGEELNTPGGIVSPLAEDGMEEVDNSDLAMKIRAMKSQAKSKPSPVKRVRTQADIDMEQGAKPDGTGADEFADRIQQIPDDAEFKLTENSHVEAFKLQKALKGMGHSVTVKVVDDFGEEVFEIYSKEPVHDESIFYDAEKLGYSNVRVFDHSMEEAQRADLANPYSTKPISLQSLLDKYNLSPKWFRTHIIDMDQLTPDELDDLEYVEDRIKAHISVHGGDLDEYNSGIHYDPSKERKAQEPSKMDKLASALTKALTGGYKPTVTEDFNQLDRQFEDLAQVIRNIAHVGEMSIEDAAMEAVERISAEFGVDFDLEEGDLNELVYNAEKQRYEKSPEPAGDPEGKKRFSFSNRKLEEDGEEFTQGHSQYLDEPTDGLTIDTMNQILRNVLKDRGIEEDVDGEVVSSYREKILQALEKGLEIDKMQTEGGDPQEYRDRIIRALKDGLEAEGREVDTDVEEAKKKVGKGKRRDTSDEREGARQAGMQMTQQTHRDKSKYTRKQKHKGNDQFESRGEARKSQIREKIKGKIKDYFKEQETGTVATDDPNIAVDLAKKGVNVNIKK